MELDLQHLGLLLLDAAIWSVVVAKLIAVLA